MQNFQISKISQYQPVPFVSFTETKLKHYYNLVIK